MSKETDVLKIDKNMTIKSVDETGLVWLDPNEAPFKLAGFNWFKQDHLYRRFPANPDPALPESVEVLCNHTAGGQLKFRTDSRRIAVKVKLLNTDQMDHMPHTGMSGFDLYLGDNEHQSFAGVTRAVIEDQEYTYELVKLKDAAMRDFTLNFPLYNGVEELSIGLESDASLTTPTPFRSDKPIVVYGTSIAQGGCACRPGMCYTNILSRKLNQPFINLAFSGSGRGEPEVAQHVASIDDPAMFVLDYEANCTGFEKLAETLPEFIRILRESHPEIPILVVSKVPFAQERFDDEKLQARLACKKVEIENVERCRAEGDNNIYFIDAEYFQGDDFCECCVDGVHPSDLGFYRMAENMLPVIQKRLP